MLGLSHAFRQRFTPGLGLDDGKFGVSIFKDVIRRERFAAPPLTFDATRRNRILAPDAAALNDAPARCFQCGINMFGSGFGFVHRVFIVCL